MHPVEALAILLSVWADIKLLLNKRAFIQGPIFILQDIPFNDLQVLVGF